MLRRGLVPTAILMATGSGAVFLWILSISSFIWIADYLADSKHPRETTASAPPPQHSPVSDTLTMEVVAEQSGSLSVLKRFERAVDNLCDVETAVYTRTYARMSRSELVLEVQQLGDLVASLLRKQRELDRQRQVLDTELAQASQRHLQSSYSLALLNALEHDGPPLRMDVDS